MTNNTHLRTQESHADTKQEAIMYMQGTCKVTTPPTKTPDLTLWDKEHPQLPEMPLGLFCVACLLLGMGPTQGLFHLEKTNFWFPSGYQLEIVSRFICKWLPVGDSFWVRDGAVCSPLFSALGNLELMQVLCLLCACCHGLALSEFLCVPVLLCLGLVSSVCSIPSGFYILSVSSTGFPKFSIWEPSTALGKG